MFLASHITIFLACLTAAAYGAGVRVCVTAGGEQDCQAMVKDPALVSLSLQCVSGRDRYGCLRKVVEKEADVTWGQAEDVYVAREVYDDQLHVLGEIRKAKEKESGWRYSGVAVVRRDKVTGVTDLRGSKSCHTGYGRTAGWNIPIPHLVNKGVMSMECSTAGPEMTMVEQDLRAASNFFGLACIPGRWAPDNITNNDLKMKYNNLCSMCSDPGRCDDQDGHAGYQGVLRCLVDSHGDVAWTKFSAVTEFFKARPEVSKADFGLLCPDGRVQDLESTKPCYWAARPWNTWLVRNTGGDSKKELLHAVTQMVEASTPPLGEVTESGPRPWASSVLGVKKPSIVHPRSPSLAPRDYLKEHGYDVTIDHVGCPTPDVKLCVDSRLAREKCLALAQVLRSRRVRPGLACEAPMLAEDDCFSMVARKVAHITSGDGGDVYRAHVEYGLTPVVTERYGLLDASYFAVAVVKADSGITSLTQLRGKTSCHTGIDRTAGWKIPVVALIEAGLLKQEMCDFPGQMGKFFSASCAPGAKDPRFDPQGTNPDSLCSLCVGNEVIGASGPPYSGGTAEGQCERKPVEAFYGYTGAFRCLVQGGGDVAFIKHTTVRDNTNGNNNESWAANLRALDFKLLCRGQGTADMTEFSTCNLARVPAHKVLTSLPEGVMKEEARILLLRASQTLAPGQDVFHMFGPYKGISDLIFKDSATELVNERLDTFHTSLKDIYHHALFELSSCTPKESTLLYTGERSDGATQTPFIFLMVATLAWLIIY
ncbi:hypothetical protein Pmani_000826 [Petrolisthes manimaculis]|uniref:Transferrin-like domain-containing protein n=1 Tax=Petrolisthes manimaculis TaxID=1843537 RepID=A0AAE1QPA1_9EUCA|nr:hypothetical protein Pmani_000826 [Petrolisthes manimaculis]